MATLTLKNVPEELVSVWRGQPTAR